MNKTSKRRAPTPEYVSEKQLVLSGFETPFSQTLDKSNRWVQLADKIPWDDLAGLYYKRYAPKATGRPPLNKTGIPARRPYAREWDSSCDM
jgi:hypothetical protein